MADRRVGATRCRTASRRARTTSAEPSSTRRASAVMTSSRTSFDGLSSSGIRRGITDGVAELADRAHHRRQRALVAGAQQVEQRRQRARAADLGERVDGALAHPPVVVARGFDQVADGALVLGLVQDLDRGATDVLVLVADQLERRLDHARAADLGERVGGAAAHPPVVVLDRLQQVLDVRRRADLVQHLDRGATGVLVLVAQHRRSGAASCPGGWRARRRRSPSAASRRRDRAALRTAGRRRRCRSKPASAFSTACRTNLLRVLELRAAAPRRRRGRLKRARMLMMCVRAIGSLPSRRLSSSGTMLVVGDVGDDAEHRRLLGRVLVVGALQHVARVQARLLRGHDADDRAFRHRPAGRAGRTAGWARSCANWTARWRRPRPCAGCRR